MISRYLHDTRPKGHLMTPRFRVLIVEDDPDIGEVESQVLGYAGSGSV